jgi:hypothetical protein
VAETALTPERPLSPGAGLGVCAQVVPFQWTVSAFPPELVLKFPTAHALPADAASTPASLLPKAPGLGLGTCAQLVPFQCTISVLVVAVVVCPTAQALEAEFALTALSDPAMLVMAGPGAERPVAPTSVTPTNTAANAGCGRSALLAPIRMSPVVPYHFGRAQGWARRD